MFFVDFNVFLQLRVKNLLFPNGSFYSYNEILSLYIGTSHEHITKFLPILYSLRTVPQWLPTFRKLKFCQLLVGFGLGLLARPVANYFFGNITVFHPPLLDPILQVDHNFSDCPNYYFESKSKAVSRKFSLAMWL